MIVVEGYFDAVALHQAGLTHTVATLGTALTAEHIQVLRRFASKVVLLFDPDQAGVRAALRGLGFVCEQRDRCEGRHLAGWRGSRYL